MLGTILQTIQKYNMLEAGDEVIAALSGGADSVCLLLALKELSGELGIRLSAIHVNHCLRGDESDRDEMFCRRLCEENGIPLICQSFDVKGEAARLKLSTEQAARNIRYRFFAENSVGKKIATAHNANDNAETVIFNLTRGTGTKGAAGIPPVRDNIIRPLLCVTRGQIEAMLRERNQDYVTDSTNLTDDYTRNRIRHNVIPVLMQINEAFIDTMTSDSENLRTDNDFIEKEAQRAYREHMTEEGRLCGLRLLHPAIRRRCISWMLSENNIEVNSRRIYECENICLSGGKINLSKNTYIISENNTLYIWRDSPAPDNTGPLFIPLREGSISFKDRIITVTITAEKPDRSDSIIADADKITGSAVIRTRTAGDRIRLDGRDFTSSVKKLIQSGIAPEKRKNACIIADENGPVFVEGSGIAARVKTGSHTKRFLVIDIQCV